MKTPPILLISVMACDYGTTADGKQDGRTLGPHSLTRLQAGFDLAQAQSSHRPVFVFSAGRLKTEHRRLCDLQAEYVTQADFPDVVVPLVGEEVWGSAAELRYAATVAKSLLYDQVYLAAVTEDYHMYPRLHHLVADICDPVLSHPVRRVAASSAASPPSVAERLHERLWFVKRCLPNRLQRWIETSRRRRLATRIQ